MLVNFFPPCQLALFPNCFEFYRCDGGKESQLIFIATFSLKTGSRLYAYNDAQFTKDDWEGIRKIYDSNKVKDPMKVGRFGLGFKSVFHLTGRRITINACGKTGGREHPPFTRGLQGLCYEDITVSGQFFAESMT